LNVSLHIAAGQYARWHIKSNKRKVLKYFQGDIQELRFYSTPDAAYEMCSVPMDVCIEMQNKTVTSKTDVTDVNEFEESSTADANPLETTSVVRNAQHIYRKKKT